MKIWPLLAVALAVPACAQITQPSTHTYAGYSIGTCASSSTITMGGLGGSPGSCAAGTPTTGVLLPTGTTVSNLSVICNNTGVSASSGVFTILKAAAGANTYSATSITLTYGNPTAGTLKSDTTHSYTASAGDRIQLQFTTQASETLGNCAATITVSP